MASVTVNGSALGTSLQAMLLADDIQPGSQPSYQLCKEIYSYHPLGAKIAEKPLKLAQSQRRDISIQKGPEDRLREAFESEWDRIKADELILNTARQARIYGVSTLAMLVEGQSPNEAVDYDKLATASISFNVFDPLNTSGSLTLSQDPNAMDYQKVAAGVSVNGTAYHRSRCVVMMNEDPIYIEWTTSAFGYVGRSVYQRVLYPLKSYIQSMVTDDMVTRKAGLLIAMMKTAGSIIDNMMAKFGGIKRSLLKQAATDNVLEIGQDDKIETLNMQNLDGAYGLARDNVLQNIAAGVPMPAILLNDETYAEGFGEGTEDAKAVAQFIDETRKELTPLYDFMTSIVQRRAWNEALYEIIQDEFPDYKGVAFNRAYYDWTNSFKAVWPSFLREPPSELVKVDDVKLRAIIAFMEVVIPNVDPTNKAAIIAWAVDNFNSLKMLFANQLSIDSEMLADWLSEHAEKASQLSTNFDQMPNEPKPFADNARVASRVSDFKSAVAALSDKRSDRPARSQQIGHA